MNSIVRVQDSGCATWLNHTIHENNSAALLLYYIIYKHLDCRLNQSLISGMGNYY